MTITLEQIKVARKLLGWSTATLARRSKRSYNTVAKAEAGTLWPRHRDTTLADLRAVLELAGVEFIPDDGGGARLREPE